MTRWMSAGAACAAFALGCGGDGRRGTTTPQIAVQSVEACAVAGAQTGAVDVAAAAASGDAFSPGWVVHLDGQGEAGVIEAEFDVGATPTPGEYRDGVGSSFVRFGPTTGGVGWFAGEMGVLGGPRHGGSFALRLDAVSPQPHGSLEGTLVPWDSTSAQGPVTIRCTF